MANIIKPRLSSALPLMLTGMLAAFMLVATFATAFAGDYKLVQITNALRAPWGLAFLPNGDMLVTELGGTIKRVSAPKGKITKISGVPEVYYSGQGGLMDIVLHPKFVKNNYVYLSFSVKTIVAGAGETNANTLRVVRARLKGNKLVQFKTIFEAAPQRTTPAHYSARMAFLPDNSLLIGVGDGFNYREEAQNTSTHFGSTVRVYDDGRIPTDNPFAKNETALPEIWSYGHRNVQAIIYDAATKSVFQAEHGARGGDELNRVQAGKNYGWPAITHGIDYNFARISPFTHHEGMEQPLLFWTPSIAPSGMAIYHGRDFPKWQGDVFVTSLTFNKVVRVDMKGTKAGAQEDLFTEIGERLRDIRFAPDGMLYILSEGKATAPGGKLWRVEPR